MAAEGDAPARRGRHRRRPIAWSSGSFALRFAGQSYSLDVPARRPDRCGGAARSWWPTFLARYRARYHHANADVPIELDHIRVAVRGPTPQVTLPEIPPGRATRQPPCAARAASICRSAAAIADCPVYDRYRLGAGAT